MSLSVCSSARLRRLREALGRAELDGVLITNLVNIGWLTGFTGSHAFAFVSHESAWIASDSRYTLQLSQECPGFEARRLQSSASEDLVGMLRDSAHGKVGFEAAHVTVAAHRRYVEQLDGALDLVPIEKLTDDLRLTKDREEVAAIETACAVVDTVFEHVCGVLAPGMSEIDVMLELEWQMRKEHGAEVAFDSIVVSGPRSAMPHGHPTDRRLTVGDLVTMDFGVRCSSYCSDITRTVVLGPATDEQRRVYATVLEAQARAIDAMQPGAHGKDVDAVARGLIADRGYGAYFGHGLGHSLGRLVHDGPSMSPTSDLTIEDGMVLTVEPGIYVPDWGGVRIEHDVEVTATGPRVLTRARTDLLEL